MDTISVIVKWLTRKITAIRYPQESSIKVFDPIAEVKKVNLASAEASAGQDMAPEDIAVKFTSTAMITQFGDDDADFQAEYDNDHPDNYSNHNELVADGSESDMEQLEGNVFVSYNKARDKTEYKKSERKTQVVPPCHMCISNGETKLHWLIKCETLVGQEVNTRYKTIGKLLLCHNCFSPDHKTRDCKRPSKCKIAGCDYRHHTLLHQTAAERSIARAAADNVLYMSAASTLDSGFPVQIHGPSRKKFCIQVGGTV
jgi:hypothetical protein